ncbi:MAG: Hint domain-containing homing endonuclease [Chloroflexota bacterium]
MKKLRALGLLLTAAALVVAGLSMQSLAKEKAKKSKKQEIKITVNNPAPPSQCSLSCSPGNLRSSGGRWSVSWASNGNSVNLVGGGPGWSENSNRSANGSTVYGIPNLGGGQRYSLTAYCSNDGGSIRASCTTILSCFLAGTKILMGDGSYKAIEDVKVGESVMSYDTEKGQFVGSQVVKTIKTQSEKYYVVNDNLKITPTHTLLVNGAWKPSQEMKVGDTLFNADGEPTQITSLKEIVQDVDVFNLFTDEPNDFFAENFLVHNENLGEDHKNRGLAAGIKIAMIDGRTLEVEKVRAGDKVLSYDPQKKRYTINVVRKTATQRVGKTLLINGKLRMAVGHPVFLADIQPVKAKKASK